MSQMTVTRFAELPLSAPTQRGIAEVLRYETMTKVQHHAIPPALAGKTGRDFARWFGFVSAEDVTPFTTVLLLVLSCNACPCVACCLRRALSTRS